MKCEHGLRTIANSRSKLLQNYECNFIHNMSMLGLCNRRWNRGWMWYMIKSNMWWLLCDVDNHTWTTDPPILLILEENYFKITIASGNLTWECFLFVIDGGTGYDCDIWSNQTCEGCCVMLMIRHKQPILRFESDSPNSRSKLRQFCKSNSMPNACSL